MKLNHLFKAFTATLITIFLISTGATLTHADTPPVNASGTWGGAPWEFDDATGALTVTGNTSNPYTLEPVS